VLFRSGSAGTSVISIAMISIAAIGIYGAKSPFWTLPPALLTGSAAAAGIALINSIGNLGGFFGPAMVGWVSTLTGSFEAPLYVLGGMQFLAAVMVVVMFGGKRAVVPAPA
jgi:MFS transporter, ACS family, tartrate transporter